MDMNNKDMNFSFQTNLAGVEAAAGGGVALDEGYYKGTVVDAYGTVSKNGRSQVAIQMKTESGATRTAWINVPTSAEDKVRHFWRAAMESLGYTPAEIDAGAVTISRNILVGRPCHFYFKPGNKDMGVYEEIKMLAPGTWATRKTQFEAKGGSALGASAAAAPVSAGIGAGIGQAVSAGIGAAPTGIGAQATGGNTVTANSLIASLNG